MTREELHELDEMQNKTFIITGTSNKLITYAKSKSTAKRRFSNHYPNERIIKTQKV